jgi:hypothetical protein
MCDSSIPSCIRCPGDGPPGDPQVSRQAAHDVGGRSGLVLDKRGSRLYGATDVLKIPGRGLVEEILERKNPAQRLHVVGDDPADVDSWTPTTWAISTSVSGG